MNRSENGTGRVLVVIPARYESSRFPGKALADLYGEPLIVRTARNAARMRRADKVVVATDDERIAAAVTAAGCLCEMTGQHPTGTDRIAEVAARYEGEIILNLQGDEPLLDPGQVDRLVDMMVQDQSIDIGTCAHPFASAETWRDRNTVKVLVDQFGFALYFSRAAIPGNFPGREDRGHELAGRHVGVYAFRRRALERFIRLAPTRYEQAEGLEQLRALESGMRIKVLMIDQVAVGVDTPADLEEVRHLWRIRKDT
ncbi:MAG: 3-deoxy-manno-octulosonate cytidylyltransferase [Gemmatimonadales bacterium]|nr:3-deoxy-manno-octulosonate cytidylyltransferase [Gemmatimonadales bacterium]